MLCGEETGVLYEFICAFQVHPWRRPASLRARPTSAAIGSVASSASSAAENKLSPNNNNNNKNELEEVQLRRVHSFESDEK